MLREINAATITELNPFGYISRTLLERSGEYPSRAAGWFISAFQLCVQACTIVRIGLRVFVQVPIFVRPHYLRLYGNEEAGLTRNAEITASLEKPLNIDPERFSLDRNLK